MHHVVLTVGEVYSEVVESGSSGQGGQQVQEPGEDGVQMLQARLQQEYGQRPDGLLSAPAHRERSLGRHHRQQTQQRLHLMGP